jgi:hypothetical protein
MHIGIVKHLKPAAIPSLGFADQFDGLAVEGSNQLGPWRFVAEALFYFIVVSTNIPDLTPLGHVRFGLGGIIDFTGLFFVLLLAFSRDPFPFSLKMAIVMALLVNASNWWAGDVPIIGEKSAPYLHWIAWLAMAIWLLRNDGCTRRMALFFAVFVIGVVGVGGVSNDNGEHRLHMDAGYGTSFMNSNDIAHVSALFAVACLFLGNQVRLRYRLIFWLAAILLMGVIVETVSRGGMIALGAGLAGFLAWSSIQKSGTNKLFLYSIALGGTIAAIIYGGVFANQFDVFSERLGTETGRSYVYNLDMLEQLSENLLIGSGTETIVRTAGNTAHNNFIYDFICYGGIMATVYLVWLAGLSKQIWRLIIREGSWGATGGMFAVFFLVGMISQVLSNQANLFCSFVFVTALIEHSKHRHLLDSPRSSPVATLGTQPNQT